jgi:hypothetical protein
MGSQTPPSRMMMPWVGAAAGPTVGVGPAGGAIGVAMAGAAPASARATTVGSTSRRYETPWRALDLRSGWGMSTFRLLTDAHV